VNLVWSDDELRRLIRPVVEEVAAAIGSRISDDRLAYPEAEAAKLLGIAGHQLRDARLRGEITATRVGGRIGFERSELLAYLARNRSK
jgi:excisionase family DNA binding protein